MFSEKSNSGKLSKWIITGCIVLLLTASYCLYVVWMSMPVIRGSISDEMILDRVEVTRDTYGIPRIIGHKSQDIYFAQGYTHAQDRMFQMIMMKQMLLGRMSEIFGKKTVKVDEYMRTLNIRQAAAESYVQFGPANTRAIEAYAAGVNKYLSENRETLELRLLGYKVEPWQPQDSVVMQKAMAFDLSRHWPRIMKNTALASKKGFKAVDEFFPEVEVVEPSVTDSDLKRHKLPYDAVPKVYPDGPEIPKGVVESYTYFAELSEAVLTGLSADETLAPGSNVWAVSAKRSESGFPILASDPHLSYNIPNTFYLIHMKSDNLDFTGASIPGAPGIIIGRNAKLAWGFTNSRLAQCDIYYDKNIPGKKKRVETFKVKGGKDFEITYYDTDYGTLISEKGAEYEVALNWLGSSRQDKTLDALHGVSVSSSLKEASQHFKNFHTPAQNIAIADDQGNYGFYALGQIPIRNHSGRVAVPATADYRWDKIIPFHQMPYTENPPRGYVMNANNRVVSAHYGYNLSKLGFDDLRAIRLVKLLKEDNRFSMQDTKDIQMDDEDQQWIIMRDELLKTEPKSPLAKKALVALREWDGMALRESYEVTIFSAWQRQISKGLYKEISAELPRWARPVHDDFFVRDALRKNSAYCQGGCAEFLSETLERAVNLLKDKYDTSDITTWKWQGSHRAIFNHSIFKKLPVLGSFSSRTVTVDGTRDSLNRSRWFGGGSDFLGSQGACLRMVVDLESSQGDFIIPMGESGNIFSKHYDDLLDIWADGEYITMPQTQSKGHEAQLWFYGTN